MYAGNSSSAELTQSFTGDRLKRVRTDHSAFSSRSEQDVSIRKLIEGGDMRSSRIATIAAMAIVAAAPATAGAANRGGHHHGGGHHRGGNGLWKLYDRTLSKARYIDLTHHITPNMPVWRGFGPATFNAGGQPGDG